MKIALCHLQLSKGPEAENIKLLEQVIELAARQGAKWILTPETAVQGYHFYKINENSVIDIQPSENLQGILSIIKQYGVWLFLGCAEHDAELNHNFNSCIIFSPDSTLIGKHRKLFGHGIGAEAWAVKGTELQTFMCGDVKTGVLVCADLWYEENVQRLKDQGAEIILDIAAWPPSKECGNPRPKWEEQSKNSGLPIVVCNQTGNTEWMNMDVGESVVIEGGKTILSYSGRQAVLVFEWDRKSGKVTSDKFQIFAT